MKERTKEELDEIWELIAADDPGDNAYLDLKKLSNTDNHSEMIEYVLNGSSIPSYDLFFFSRAGYKEAERYLRELYDSKDENAFFWVCLGLAIFNDERAYQDLILFAKKSHPVGNSFIDPIDDVYEQLQKIPTEKAKEIVENFKSGEYGEVPED